MSLSPEKLCAVLEKYAQSIGMCLNSDKEFALDILEGLLKNEGRYGYRSCPCRLATGRKELDEDIICPCRYRDADIREYGSCYCSLYVSGEWIENKVPHIVVPERRPAKR